jgi:acetylglutamate kinase
MMVQGFRFAGLHAGIKPTKKDLALVVSDVRLGRRLLTINRAQAAPVQDAQPGSQPPESAPSWSTVATPTPSPARRVARAWSASAGRSARSCVPPESIFTASTGVIGVPLPLEKITQGLPRLAESLGASCEPAAEAIMTTDTHPRWRGGRSTGGREVSISASPGLGDDRPRWRR